MLRLRQKRESDPSRPSQFLTVQTHMIRWVREMTSLIHEIADDATLEIQKRFPVMYQTADKAPTGRATA